MTTQDKNITKINSNGSTPPTAPTNIVVLKIGGSVLGDESKLADAVHEVYREVRAGHKVVAVVSAIGYTTDKLINRAAAISPDPEPVAFASLLATGEATSAAQVALALDAAGIPTALLTSAQLAIRTRGTRLDGEPRSLNAKKVLEALDRASAVVVPGFIGIDKEGETTLLGRGGSDLTALFVAKQIGASRVRLIKDVDGWFLSDPATSKEGAATPKYTRLAWEDALASSAPIVQPKAVRYAKDHKITFEVGAVGSHTPTLVGLGPTQIAAKPPGSRPLRVGLLGLGTVGWGVYQHLARDPRFTITGVLVRNTARYIGAGFDHRLLTDNPGDILGIENDLIIEAISAAEPARAYLAAALDQGYHVVTANKAVVSSDGVNLSRLANQRGVTFTYSGAVGGGAPILETLKRAAAEGPIDSIRGVVNGTTNFILDRLAQGDSYDEAIAEGQRRGLTEADPTQDTKGIDAAQKLAILVREAFDDRFDVSSVKTEGIESLATTKAKPGPGRVFRLVATAQRTETGVDARVSLETLDATDPLAGVVGEQNLVIIKSQDGRETVVRGRGAGRAPTAEAVWADVQDVANRFAAGEIRVTARKEALVR